MKHINTIILTPSLLTNNQKSLEENIHSRAVVKKKKPLLSARHRKARLAFAQKYREWTVEDWKRVIWSDEMKINRFGVRWKRVGVEAGCRGAY